MLLSHTSPRRAPRAVFPSLRAAIALHRSRRALAALSDDALRDVGLDRAQARAEAARPLWDAPASWKS